MTGSEGWAPAGPAALSLLVRVRRKPARACYDSQAVHAVLDAAPFSHVATIRDGRPVVLPMAHGRIANTLFLHGSRVAGLFRDTARGSPVCVTATILDGLVFGRSARNHSMNYRSVTVHGSATLVTDPAGILEGLRAIVDHVSPGRWEQVRKPTTAELRETALWRVAIEAASVKSRAGPALDPASDRQLPVWAGHIPVRLTYGAPVPAEGLPPRVEFPGHLRTSLTPLPFGAVLRRHRNAARLTQEELAMKASMSVRAVADMERGRTARPYRRSVARLADALDLSDDERAVFHITARAGTAEPGGPANSAGSVADPARPAPRLLGGQLAAGVLIVGQDEALCLLPVVSCIDQQLD